ncbi:hypothetical protein BGZ59_008496, partial [Podila verticillata]
MSKTSRATSPSPSLTSSVFSDESSLHSSHHHQHTQSIQQIQQQQQQQQPQQQQQHQQQHQQRPRQGSQPQTSIRPPTRSSVASIPEQTRSTLSTASSDKAPSSRPTSPLPSPGSKRVTVLKSTSSSSGGSDSNTDQQQRSSSPNLRSRISRLFRQSPKPEKVGPVLDQRYRAEQQKLYQESLHSNTGTKASSGGATAIGSAVNTADSAHINKQLREQHQQQTQQQPPSPQQHQHQHQQQESRPTSPSPALQFNIEEEEVMDDHEDEPTN